MRGSLIEVSVGRRRREQSSLFVLLRSSSSGRINFLFIVFRLEYTVIKRPDGIRSRMPGNQSSLCSLYIPIYINILFIRYFLFIILFSLFILFRETHIFIATFFFFFFIRPPLFLFLFYF